MMTFKISASDICYIPVKAQPDSDFRFSSTDNPGIKGIFFILLPGINL